MPATGNGAAVATMLAGGNARMTTQAALERVASAPAQTSRFDAMLTAPELPPKVTLPKEKLPGVRMIYKHDGRPGEME